jgi:hypothetical protein
MAPFAALSRAMTADIQRSVSRIVAPPTTSPSTRRGGVALISGTHAPLYGIEVPNDPDGGRGRRIPAGGARVTPAIMPQPGSLGPFPVIV